MYLVILHFIKVSLQRERGPLFHVLALEYHFRTSVEHETNIPLLFVKDGHKLPSDGASKDLLLQMGGRGRGGRGVAC